MQVGFVLYESRNSADAFVYLVVCVKQAVGPCDARCERLHQRHCYTHRQWDGSDDVSKAVGITQSAAFLTAYSAVLCLPVLIMAGV